MSPVESVLSVEYTRGVRELKGGGREEVEKEERGKRGGGEEEEDPVCAKVWSGQWLELSGERESGLQHF